MHMQVPHAGGVLRNYVGGEFVLTDRRFDNVNPVNGRIINAVCEADRPLVDRAVVAARSALHGAWGRLPVNARCELLHRVAEGIEARFDEFVAAEMADTGKSLSQARGIDIPRGAANFRIFADLAKNRSMQALQRVRVQ